MLKGLLITAGFGLFTDLGANHILGGEIGYSHMGGNKYRFRVHVYRNCNECEFNSGGCADIRSLDIMVSPEVSSTPNLLDQINLTRLSRRDITPVCASRTTVCKGGSFPEGIEDWYYEGDYDFSTLLQQNCRFEVSLKVDSRLDAWSLGLSESHYNFTRLNLCSGVTNSTPQFGTDAAYLLPYNQSFVYHMLPNDPEKDSLSFELVNAQRGFNRNITYGSGYNGKKPVDAYCPSGNCSYQRGSWPAQGIGMEPASGWLTFTPVKLNQSGFLVIQCTEWRKVNGSWVAVGVSRRDMQYLVTDQTNYVPKVSTTSDTFFACAGEEFALDVSVNDPVYGIRDSVRLDFRFPLPKGRIGIAGGNGVNNYDALWIFSPDSADIGKSPYRLTLTGRDNHCPVNAFNYKDVTIFIAPKPSAAFGLRHVTCNRIAFSAVGVKKGELHSWFIFDKSGMIESVTGDSGFAEVPSPGTYRVLHQVKNAQTGCMTEITDSVDVPWFDLMRPGFEWPASVCRGDSITLRAAFNGGTPGFDFTWNGQTGDITRDFVIRDSQTIRLNIVDANGCKLDYSSQISIWPAADLRVTDTVQCMPLPGQVLNLNSRFRIDPVPGKSTEMIRISGDGILNKTGEIYSFRPFKSGSSFFRLHHTDVNGCRYLDTFQLTLVDPPPTGIKDPSDLCSNGQSIDLKTATGCVLSGGSWILEPVLNGFNGSRFDPVASGSGQWQAVYSLNYSGCQIRDTAIITVNAAPVIRFAPSDRIFTCENSSPFLLSASPGGGKWESVFGSGNQVKPAQIKTAGYDSADYSYYFQDVLTGCSSKDTTRVYVSGLPSVKGMRDTWACGNSRLLIRPVLINAARMEIIGFTGPATLKRNGEDILLEAGDVLAKDRARLKYTLHPLPACNAVSVEQTIEIRPVPGGLLQSSPAEACVPFQSRIELISDGKRPLPDATSWSIDPGNPDVLSRVLQVNLPGEKEVSALISLQGCEGSELRSVVIGRETPVASFSIDPRIRITTADFPYFVFRNNSRSADSMILRWTFNGGRPATGFLPKHDVSYPQDTGTYRVTLRVTTSYGCTDFTENSVVVMPRFRLWVPNAFTPDKKGPAANEGWGVYIDSMSEYSLIVRSKWGEIMFKSNDPHATWDGNYLGKPAPAGMYAWHIKGRSIYGRYIDEKGTFALIR